MLESMRNLAQTLVAKILMGLLVVAFGVWGISGVAGSAFEVALRLTGWGPKDLAQVGAITINGDEYAKNLQRQIRSMAAQTGQQITLDDARKFGINTQVLDAMLAQAAVTTAVKKLGLTVSQQDILNDLASDKHFQDATGKFSVAAFHTALEQNGITEAQYFASQIRMRTETIVVDTASTQLALPKTFSDALGQYVGEARDVKYFDVTAAAADVAKPSDADIEAQYKKDPAAYTAPEYRTAVVMGADIATLAATQTISEDEIKAGYDKNKASFATPEKRTIIQITFPDVDAATKAKARIAAGEDIMKIAGELNLKDTDVTLADKVREDFLDPAIGDAAFALKEGEVSEPVKGALATALLKAVKVTAGKQPSLDEVKPELTKMLQTEKAKAMLQEVYNAVEDARAKTTKFEDIAKAQGLNLTVLPPVSAAGLNQDGKDISATIKPEVLKAIFSSDVGVDNDALQVADGYYWYEVRSVIPSALKPLDQVKDQAAQDITNARVRKAALDKAQAIADTLKGGKTIDTAAQDAGQTAKVAQNLKRNQQSAEFDGAALAAAFSVLDQGYATSPGGDGKTARVMQVIKVSEPAVMAASPELTQAREQLKGGFANDMQGSLIEALKKQAGVKINTDLWKQNNGGEAPPVE